jgi:hypothetical protein
VVGDIVEIKKMKEKEENEQKRKTRRLCQSHDLTSEDWKNLIFSDETEINRFSSDGN